MLKNDKPLFGLFQDRIELANYIANLRMKNLQRFADGRSIIEKYIGGNIAIHVHFAESGSDSPNDGVCLRYRSISSQINAGSHEVAGSGQSDELPVFVNVRQSVQKFEIRSMVGLESLDHCEVFVGEMFETARPILGEELFSVIDRKLSSILDRTGINPRENEDDIIECSAEMKNHLTDKDEHIRQRLLVAGKILLPNSILTVGAVDLDFSFTQSGSERFQLRQLFPCPFNPELGLLKVAHLL